MTNDLTKSVSKIGKKLILRESFYGLLLLTIHRLQNLNIPTAGVSLQGINVNLSINSEFWFNELPTDENKMAVIKHELLHIAMFHLHMRSRYPDKTLFNIAADMEINQYIKREWFPHGNLTKSEYTDIVDNITDQAKKIQDNVKSGNITETQGNEQISKLDKVPMRPVFLEDYNFDTTNEVNKGTKYYYDRLSQMLGTGNSPMLDSMYNAINAGVPTFVSHETWNDFENLPEATKKLVQSQIDHQLKETTKTVQKSRGTIPGELRDYIEELLETKPAIIDWKSYFRLFAGSSSKTTTRKSRRRPSKRYEGSPSIKIKPLKHVLFAVDTSGSMSEPELQECFAELIHVKKSGVEVTVIECDAKVGRIYPYTSKASVGTKISGGGGTDFQPVIDHYNEFRHIYTSLIYFTDGYAPNPANPKPLKHMLWVLSSGNSYGSKEVSSMEEEGFPGVIVKMQNN